MQVVMAMLEHHCIYFCHRHMTGLRHHLQIQDKERGGRGKGNNRETMTAVVSYISAMVVVAMAASDDKLLFQPLSRVGNVREGATICPDDTSCPAKHTCCPRGSNYVCCPFDSATCCADQHHCCPVGTQCDMKAGTCTPKVTDGAATPVFLTAASQPKPSFRATKLLVHASAVLERVVQEVTPDIICPDGGQCPKGDTCCPTNGKYSCCSYDEATCCADHKSCCPHGCRCDLARRRCLCSATYPPFLLMAPPTVNQKQKKLPRELKKADKRKENTICPDGSRCPAFYTCCPRGSMFACCPYASATCCADQNHCCPHDYTCDVPHQRCIQGNNIVPAIFQAPARIPGEE